MGNGREIPEAAVFTQDEIGLLYGIVGLLRAEINSDKERIWQSARTQHRIKVFTVACDELWSMLEEKTVTVNDLQEGANGTGDNHASGDGHSQSHETR